MSFFIKDANEMASRRSEAARQLSAAQRSKADVKSDTWWRQSASGVADLTSESSGKGFGEDIKSGG